MLNLNLESAYSSCSGRGRRLNHNRVLVEPACFAIADGVGQRPGGDAAAQVAVDTLWAFATYASCTDLLTVMRTADRAIRAMAASDRAFQCASTAMTAVRLESTESGVLAKVASVGDSQLLVFRKDRIVQFPHGQVDAAHEPGESWAGSPGPGLTGEQALGMGPNLAVSTQEVSLEPNDRLLLCTGAVTTQLSNADLRRIEAQSTEPGDFAGRLVWAALAAGSERDVTAVVVDVDRSAAKPIGSRTPTATRVGQLVAA